MNEQHEKLSSLMDDFHPAEQDQDLLQDVLNDVNQRYTMRRYQMIGDVMRNEISPAIRADFVSNVMSQIELEPELNVEPSKPEVKAKSDEQSSSWLWSVFFKPIAGLAVAATVAVVAVSNIQLQSTTVDQPEQLASASSTATDDKVKQLESISFVNKGGALVSTNNQNPVSSVGTNWKIKHNGPEIQKKLNVYLVNHNEFSNSWQGILPQVRVVGFDAKK